MPLNVIRKAARTRRHDPFTGREIIAPDPGAPAVEADPIVRTDIFALLDRQDALAALIRDRSGRAATAIRNEATKYANDPSAHPVRRLRLRYKRGPISIEELSTLSGVSPRAIKRVEAGEPASDLVLHALAVALEARRDQVDPAWINA